MPVPAYGEKNMNLSHKNYLELKQDAQTVRDAIAAKQNERQALMADINQLHEKIDTLSQTLAREEIAMGSASKLKQSSMTALDFIVHRKELEAMQGELPTLNEAIAFLDRSMESLQAELRTINDWLNRKLDLSSKDLEAQIAARFVATSSADFKNLVTAVIAANPAKPHILIGGAVCDAVFKALQDAEGYQFPDFAEARRFVAERLNTVAEAV
jgi:hypothetical protein